MATVQTGLIRPSSPAQTGDNTGDLVAGRGTVAVPMLNARPEPQRQAAFTITTGTFKKDLWERRSGHPGPKQADQAAY